MPQASGTLSLRAINRATLARQMLLERAAVSAPVAVERLAGLQAQLPRPPFVGLWTRLSAVTREDVLQAVHTRALVRGTLMRATLHLVSRADFIALRSALQPMFEAAAGQWVREHLPGLDIAALVAEARAHFASGHATFDDLREHLRRRFPRAHDRAMGYVVRLLLPTVQVPESGAAWGYPGQAAFTLADAWLGEPLPASGDPQRLALRYLAAFGPATARDLQTWSGLGGCKDVLESLRPKLRSFRDEAGRELFDLPKAPRPDEDTPAPVRYLPEYDNLLIGYADRTRIVAPAHKGALASRNLFVPATCLVDGMMAGTWRLTRTRAAATIAVTAVAKLPRAARTALTEEGERLARFLEPDAAKIAVTFADAG